MEKTQSKFDLETQDNVPVQFCVTDFKPFQFHWARTAEICELLHMGYVFPALTDAVLLPDMFGWEYDDAKYGSTPDERHYKGWCDNNFSLYGHPVGSDSKDYNLLNPTLCYKIRNYIVHGTSLSVDGKDDLNIMLNNTRSRVRQEWKEVVFRLVSGIYVNNDALRDVGECFRTDDGGLAWIFSTRTECGNTLYVDINAYVYCMQLIRMVDWQYQQATDEDRKRYDATYLHHRRLCVTEMQKKKAEYLS